MNSSYPQDGIAPIVVIGAGAVGASSALALASAGHRVLMLDPRGLCGGTSFGNAGGIHIGAIQPFATPGILWSAMKMLADPQGPLLLDWRYLPRSLPWFARFLLNSSARQMSAGAAATAAINHTAIAAWRNKIASAPDGHVSPIKPDANGVPLPKPAPEPKKCIGHAFVFDVSVNINHESVSAEGITDGSRLE